MKPGALIALLVALVAAPVGHAGPLRNGTAPGAATVADRADRGAAGHGAESTLPALQIEQSALRNGLGLVLNEDHRLPLVAVQVLYRVGAADEPKQRSGFAHLFEHLMFQGSEHFNREYFEAFEPIGAVINGTTGQDFTVYYERVPSNYLERALWMESDRMFNLLPALTQQKLDNQRAVVRNERRQRYENAPYGMAEIYLNRLLYPPGHPYHEPVIGSHEDLSSASLHDVKDFFARHYVPGNVVVSIAGDFDPARARALVERYFGRSATRPAPPAPIAAPPILSRIEKVTRTDSVAVPKVHLAWHTPALFTAGDAELDLWSSVLAGGKTSRLYQELVYRNQVASAVSAQQVSHRLSSYFLVEVTAAPGRTLVELEAAIFRALREAGSRPPAEDEMERAVNDYRKSFYARVEGVTSRAAMLARYSAEPATA